MKHPPPPNHGRSLPTSKKYVPPPLDMDKREQYLDRDPGIQKDWVD